MNNINKKATQCVGGTCGGEQEQGEGEDTEEEVEEKGMSPESRKAQS